MPVFKDYDTNGKLIQTREEPLNADNLARYIKENNIDRAKGYADCLEDFVRTLDSILFFMYPDGKIGYPNTASIVRRDTKKLYAQKADFLEFAKTFIESSEAPPKSEEPKL